MLSSKLIQVIEDHWEPITSRILREIRQDSRMKQIGKLPESELLERGQHILKRLGHWLAAASRIELAKENERLGRLRFEESIPLQEVVLAQLIIKNTMIDFLQEQGIARTSMDLYAEEELERRIDRFFDDAIYHVVRGYEEALRQALERSSAVAAGKS